MNEQDIEAVLADFRSWLREALTAPDEAEGEVPAESARLDLHTLLAQFTALRQEVNLQTRSSRGQLEQNGEALRKLSEALDALRASREEGKQAEAEAEAELVRPFLKTLVETHDALALAQREVQRVEDAVLPALESRLGQPMNLLPVKMGFWSRWLGGGKTLGELHQAEAAANEAVAARAADAVAQVSSLVASLIDGYTMSLQRLERTFERAGLERIAAAGETFDPETMEVIEVVREPGRSGTLVLDEVRAGYRWRGRVLRFAQVRVARP